MTTARLRRPSDLVAIVLRLTPRIVLMPLASALAVSCALPPPGGPGSHEGAVIITDRNGDRFDITHAVRHYRLRRERFQFGIGRHKIQPLDHPRMLGPADEGYPRARGWSSGPEVIGAALDGEVRGYPVRELRRHEIVNETIGAVEAAVAY